MSEAAKAALLKLPEKQRTAVALYVIEGIDCSVIARIMNCSEATVRTHIHRARGMLKKMLDEYSDR
ncbi:MAG TPA: sigma factor-like helix-turn-helix DNA-binding protein, partial [bacterium]|nr:sigma factor-like helix-turn-helix DNA-binding protein [bacterium]